ncbi:MAG: efflux RND transporter periplasmic adaptor subunit [Tepidisphaeraceae bacterium]
MFAALGCEKPPEPTAAPPAPVVGVAKPLVKEVVDQDIYTGRLGPVESVDVRPRVGGYVDSIHFTDGQLVNKGDLLFVIDPRPYVAAARVADGEVAEAQSRLDVAKNDLDRTRNLVATKAVSQEEFDRRGKTAEAAAATLQTAKARAERAKLDVEFAEVRAPMAGRIARHLVSVGNLVAGGTSDSTLLTNIVTTGSVYAYFDIDEQAYLRYLRADAGGAKVFQNTATVELSVLGENDFHHKGTLDFIDNQVDPATGTLRARALFKNDNSNFAPGVFVNVRLAGSAPKKAVLIADRAVQADQSDRFVYVVGNGNVVKQKRVQLGRLFNGLRVVTGGLDGSESVVVDGVQRARPGTPVQPEQTELVWNEPGSAPVASAAIVSEGVAQ